MDAVGVLFIIGLVILAVVSVGRSGGRRYGINGRIIVSEGTPWWFKWGAAGCLIILLVVGVLLFLLYQLFQWLQGPMG
jgi:hypothetical protein